MRPADVLNTIFIGATAVTAAKTFVHNNCDSPVYVTSVGAKPGETEKLDAGRWSPQDQYFDGNGIGTAIKITKNQWGLYSGEPVLHFSYTYNKGQNIYYDLSSHLGFDFWGKKLTITGDEGVETIVWDGKPGPQHTAVAWGEHDLTLTLCAE